MRAALLHRALGFLSLFTSFGTLICCALPALLVLVGLGASVASALSAAPWLVSLSRNKAWVFAGAGVLIGLNVAYVYGFAPGLRTRGAGCLQGDSRACGVADRMSRVMLWSSAVTYVAGVLVAYVLGPLLLWLDS
ncbi:MAG: hypothetical protein R2752_12240 [Vicinamibacterales bacterium]